MNETETRRNPSLERDLDEMDVPWRYVEAYPLGDVDEARSLANQARFEPLDADTVERYRLDIDAGDLFPALLVREGPSGGILLGGNHRWSAANQLGVRTQPAYVVDCDDSAAIVLSYLDNRRHGLPVSIEERLAQAVHLIEAHGFNQAKAARTVGAGESNLSRYLSGVKGKNRARSLGLALGTTPETVWSRLNSVKSDSVFTAAVEIMREFRLNVVKMQDVVPELNRRTEADALLLLEEWRADPPWGANRGRPERNRRDAFLALVKALENEDPKRTARACVRPEDARSLAERCRGAARHLMAVGKAAEGREETLTTGDRSWGALDRPAGGRSTGPLGGVAPRGLDSGSC